MVFSVQRASIWKRISAFLFDFILLGIVTVLFAFLLSAVLGYDGYANTLSQCYDRYSAEYGVDFQMSLAQYDQLTEEGSRQLDAAYQALGADADAVYAYEMIMRLTLIILSVSMLLGHLSLELLVPRLLGNGQTLGKKIFSLGVMRQDGVRLSGLSLFVRTVLGKYTIEAMAPALILLMLYFGMLGLAGTLVLLLLLLLQVVLTLATHFHTPIHDLLAGTVVVDLPSQMIFDSPEAMIAYKEARQAEKAAAQPY